MTNTINNDETARQQAIDPTRSFIIQAPAGSGKTELLAQRYLKLLGTAVKNPEEVIAITFTRKAASEMRERIIHALNIGINEPEPKADFQKTTWQLARTVIAKNTQFDWQLLENPNRLRILTIDALSALISGQIPLLAGFGAKPNIVDDPTQHFQQAVYQLLQNPGNCQPGIETLLEHVENNADQLVRLLMQLLAKRDQWLPHIITHIQDPSGLRNTLEDGLKNIARENMIQAKAAIPAQYHTELAALASFAANQLLALQPNHTLCHCAPLTNLPGTSLENLSKWRGLAELCLTKQLSWRKTVDKRLGFPATHRSEKSRIKELLAILHEIPGLQQHLTNLTYTPPINYSHSQWDVVTALLQVLPRLTAELHVIFRAHSTIDFTELTLGALRALGTDEQPTDLALYFDYQIQHILLDEFQDTSMMQYHLLLQLIKEWQPDDGKTLFLVGDPMQSIYRFRNAEVGLFIRAQQQGVGNITLQPLTLTRNFRSSEEVVHWINSTFSNVFPISADVSAGAIPYTKSIAAKTQTGHTEICYHACCIEDCSNSQKIAALVQQQQVENPEASIAILVRARSQLYEIIPELNEANIPFQAVELETLNHRPEIRDILALTKALLHLGDRVSWLAILRAPWCGLTLTDLHALCRAAGNSPLWVALKHYDSLELTQDAKLRLSRIMPLFIQAIANQGRSPLSSWIKGTWQGLSGPACLQDITELNNTSCYFELLESMQDSFDLTLFEEKLKKLFAKPDQTSSSNLQLMTIHKSKGLEFDHVILPELQKASPVEPNSLLMWLEHPSSFGTDDLILAPIKANYEQVDAIHHYLKFIEKQKLDYESARVFYVAATRAKKGLHLFAKLKLDAATGEFKAPASGSFLSLIWKQYQENFMAAFSHTPSELTHAPEQLYPVLERLPIHWQSNLSPCLDLADNFINNESQLTQNIHIKADACIGTVMHEALAALVTHSKQSIPQTHWLRRLQQLGLNYQTAATGAKQIQQAILATLADPKGQWILQPHKNGHCEYAITSEHNGKFQTHIIDRTFIDEEDTLWIIDYKSATPNQGQTLEDFLAEQLKTHQDQLNRYAEVMAPQHPNPIKLALYFPTISAWTQSQLTQSNQQKAPSFQRKLESDLQAKY